MKKLTFLFAFLSIFQVLGQDSLRIMYYNLLKFPSTGASRTTAYRSVLQHAQPDIFIVNELESELGADLLLDSSLNVNGINHFQRADFVDGYDTDNCLFYNDNKVGLVSQFQLNTVLRDISVYRMYYKAPNLTAGADTVYLWFIGCHLKAGSGEFEQRNQEALQIKYYLNDIEDQIENVFVGGDFNFYSGFESGALSIQNAGNVPLVDPEDVIGNWSNNTAYANWHTQSTRNSSVGGGSGGGMDDRFDIIFITDDILSNENGVRYIDGTYKPLGQDGNRFNNSVNAGTNTAVPDSIADALYQGSDHLPIMMDVALDQTASVTTEKMNYLNAFYDPSDHSLQFNSNHQLHELVLFDLMGKKVLEARTTEKRIQLPENLSGIYIWSIVADGQAYSNKISIY